MSRVDSVVTGHQPTDQPSVEQSSVEQSSVELLADVRRWKGLLRIGACAAVASVALTAIQIVIYVVSPPPESTVGLYRLLLDHPARGLVALDLLYVVTNALVYLLYFALAAVLWRAGPSTVVIALASGVLGMAAYMASPRPAEMLALAHLYQGAGPVEQTAVVAVGDGMRATWMGTAFDIYYYFNRVALLLFAAVMLRSEVFTRTTAVWGLVAATLMAVPTNFGTVGLYVALASLFPWSVFAILVARRLFGLLSGTDGGQDGLPQGRTAAGTRRSAGPT